MIEKEYRRKILEDVFANVMYRHRVQDDRSDMLIEMFARQEGFMAMLKADDRLPAWPMDLSSKENQRKLQGFLWDAVREIAEAGQNLRNRVHRVQEDTFDREAFLEEMVDAWSFQMESLMLAGFSADELYEAFLKKNEKVREGLITGDR
jgi:hypothetical protein